MMTSVGSTGGGGASSAQVTKVYDQRDTNKDGKVSFMEQLMFDLKYPDKAEKANGNKIIKAETYDRSGNMSAGSQSSILDVQV